jgi:hypothetical protein
MSAHTPGPWLVRPAEVTSGWGLCVGNGKHIVAQLKGPAGAEKVANASLIAAAPEMLEALLDLVALLPDPELDVDAVQREYVLAARAVIAKATGEAA